MVISFQNEDGGAGKTTLTSSLATILASPEGRNKTVLLVDFTPKRSITKLYLKDLDISPMQTVYAFIRLGAEVVVFDTENPNIKILAGDKLLETMNGAEYDAKLLQLLTAFRDQFDYILIDCANNGTLVDMAYIASDEVIIVLKASRDSYDGAVLAKRRVDFVRDTMGYPIKIRKVILNMYDDNNSTHNRVVGQLLNDPELNPFYQECYNIPDNSTVNRLQYNFQNAGLKQGHVGASKMLVKIAGEVF